MKLTTSVVAGRAPREESRGRLQDLVGPAQLTVLLFQLNDALMVIGRDSRPLTVVDPQPA
jgi:hypothetical protein